MSSFSTFVIYFGTTQPPLQTNEGFEDRLKVIMAIDKPNTSGNSEKIKQSIRLIG